ncbi:MAG: class I SAM-dependent methyltransferase [Planctomycetes bacterium]|nr:class I SAM-dependent methyltransferase [Planctomycetota bacterium]
MAAARRELDEAMKAYYAQRAREYEEVYAKPERQDDLKKIRSFLSGAFEGLEVLEIACGTGYWTQIIAHSARSLLATDASREVLDVARAKDYGRCRVTFLQSDAYELIGVPTFQESAFAGFWWSHVPAKRQLDFLVALHGKLRPNAKVVLADNRYVEGSSTPISRTDKEGNTYQVRKLKDGSKHEALKNFPSEAGLEAQFSRVGQDVKVRCLEYFWVVQYRTY